MAEYVMALDQGTTSCRTILFDGDGQIVSIAQKEFPQIYPRPGWVEHDPMEIWASQLAVSMEAMAQVGAAPADVAAIGITNQRETTIVWNRHTGVPVYNAIVWQCRRTADRIRQLEDDGLGDYVKERTGLIPDAYFSASKVEWILENVEGAREAAEAGDLLFGTIDTWLIWQLTHGEVHVTDYTNAARTMMFDIHRRCWDETILNYFHIPRAMLPEVRPSGCVYGHTDVLGGSIPIAGAAGDQQAALFGQCGFFQGDVKNTYGTGGFVLMNTGTRPAVSEQGLLTTIAASIGDTVDYALEGSIFVAGAAVQWLRDEMQMITDAAESEKYARSVPDTNGMYVVPAFTGIGAPYWDAYARGAVVGLTRGCGKAHFIRATLESMAYQTRDILEIMEAESGVRLQALRVDGGASRNDFLLQFQADILGIDVVRPACVETTALGAAYLAGLTVGFWPNRDALRCNGGTASTFSPHMDSARREELLAGWHRAVTRSLAWAKEE